LYTFGRPQKLHTNERKAKREEGEAQTIGKENKKIGREMYRGSHGHNTCMCKKCAC
jgi:hypothetical protein